MKSSIMGDDANESKQQKILNRIVTWTSEAIEYEADPRHAKIIMQYDNTSFIAKVPGCKGVNDREQYPE